MRIRSTDCALLLISDELDNSILIHSLIHWLVQNATIPFHSSLFCTLFLHPISPTYRADKKNCGIKIDYKNCASRWSLTHLTQLYRRIRYYCSSSSFYWASVANDPNVLQPYWLIVLPLDVPDLTASLLL